MVTNLFARRYFMASATATVLTMSLPIWGKQRPAFLSCAKAPDGAFLACGLSESGDLLFKSPLPGRGHELIYHPEIPVAVAFGRRPGFYASVIDSTTGEVLDCINSSAGRHFYGHGVFSSDGRHLYTSENDYNNATGIIGVWSVFPFRRLGELSVGGIGPHDICISPDNGDLLIANGGLETHPSTGRHILNAHDFTSNITRLNVTGKIKCVWELEPHQRMLSIRHLSVGANNVLAFAAQNQDTEVIQLAGIASHSGLLSMLETPKPALQKLRGYVSSIALNNSQSQLAITSSRGGIVQIYDTETLHLIQNSANEDISGIAPSNLGGFIATNGFGAVFHITDDKTEKIAHHNLTWDNHLVAFSSFG